jgi:hypothetical protein
VQRVVGLLDVSTFSEPLLGISIMLLLLMLFLLLLDSPLLPHTHSSASPHRVYMYPEFRVFVHQRVKYGDMALREYSAGDTHTHKSTEQGVTAFGTAACCSLSKPEATC